MKPKVKRIIAREGLIIIVLIVLAYISFFIDSRINKHKSLYEANVQEITPVATVGESKAIILQFPKNTSNDIIKQTIKRDFLNNKFSDDNWIVWDNPNGENINASYNEKGIRVFNNIIYKIGWSDIALFFLIFAYPLYLVIRFIIWAIVTLKRGKEVHV